MAISKTEYRTVSIRLEELLNLCAKHDKGFKMLMDDDSYQLKVLASGERQSLSLVFIEFEKEIK